MNKIGFNVLAWSAAINDQLKPTIDRLQQVGYNGVEFFIGQQEVAAYQDMGRYTSKAGIEVTAVMVVGKNTNPISPDASIRLKAIEQIKWSIDRAYDLNASLLCGPFHSAHTVFAQHAPQQNEYGWAAEVLHACGEHAAQANITLVLEALNRFECYLCNTMEQLAGLIRLTDHTHVKAMFDTHHANIEEKNFKTAIELIAPYLAHVHISENDRGTPGEGHINFEEIFSALAKINYKGWLTIEAFSRNDPDFANAIGVWREFSDPWDIAEKGYEFIVNQLQKQPGNGG